MKKKKLIIALIADDLMNQKLIGGLQAMGVDASVYRLFLSTLIFKLMGYNSLERNMGLYDRYHALCERVNTLDISESTVALKQLAGEVYEGMRK